MKQPPLNVRLPDDLAEKYRKVSVEKDLPVSTLLRWAATVYMSGIESGKIILMPYGDPDDAEGIAPPLMREIPAPESAAKRAEHSKTISAKKTRASPNVQTGS